MSYQVLARRLRPKKFADLVGQEHVVRALLNSLKTGKTHHAYLFTGTRGVGKTTLARILAKSLNCLHPQGGEPCGVCEACVAIDEGRFPDLMELDAASNTGIDNIREVLENARYKPTAGRYKIYIIDEVHMLSKSAFNAMLKTLEEPPPHVKFILATTDPHKVPITVLSRCLQFTLKNLAPEQIEAYLTQVLSTDKIPFASAAAALLARAARGSMRDGLSLLDQALALGGGKIESSLIRDMLGLIDRDELYQLLSDIHHNEREAVRARLVPLSRQSVSFAYLLDELAVLLKDLALAQIASQDSMSEAFATLAQELAPEEIQLFYQTVILGKKDLGLAPDEYTGFLMVILRLLSFEPYFARETKNKAESGAKIPAPPASESVLSKKKS